MGCSSLVCSFGMLWASLSGKWTSKCCFGSVLAQWSLRFPLSIQVSWSLSKERLTKNPRRVLWDTAGSLLWGISLQSLSLSPNRPRNQRQNWHNLSFPLLGSCPEQALAHWWNLPLILKAAMHPTNRTDRIEMLGPLWFRKWRILDLFEKSSGLPIAEMLAFPVANSYIIVFSDLESLPAAAARPYKTTGCLSHPQFSRAPAPPRSAGQSLYCWSNAFGTEIKSAGVLASITVAKEFWAIAHTTA